MTSFKRHEGHLMIDHRASPGIPPGIAVKMGFLPEEVEEGALFECATITCKHCATAYVKNPRRIRPRGYCKSCDRYVCDQCEAEMYKADYVHRCKDEVLDGVMDSAHHGHTFDPATPKSPTIFVP